VTLNVVSVTYHEAGHRTLCVDEDCSETHEVAWPMGTLVLDGELPCGAVLSGLEITAWCVDPKFRTGFRKYPPRAVANSERSVFPMSRQIRSTTAQLMSQH
jgi:hypothetical protein